jgi:hypothetical protein
MEPIMFLILSISIIGIFIIFELSHVKIENNVSSQLFGERGHDLNSFMTKIKDNSSKVRL